jgi:putative ABC transport system permease protein
MLRNNFKIAIRNLWKNKASSFINLFGLTTGLSSCLLIGLYIQHELSYDSFQSNGERIARVIMEYSFEGTPEPKRGNFTSTKVAPVFTRTFPEVESAVRMTDRDMIVRHKDNLVTEPNFMFADSTFFDVFAHHFLEGNPQMSLDGPFKMVLTESASKKYFGNESALGKILLVGSDETPYEVTGVMDDYPQNSQIKFDLLASFSSLGVNQEETYFDANYTTYLLLTDAASFPKLQEKVTSFMKEEMAGSGASINYILENFRDVHLHSEYAGFVPNNSIAYLYILGAVVLLILIIVCFTYVNLSTAKSIDRAKEIGIRKVVGAARAQLFWQFMGESGILFFASILVSILVTLIALPYFNDLSGRQLQFQALLTPSFMLFAVLVTAAVSVLAGIYPAAVLTRLQPVRVLKGVFRTDHGGKWVQQSLIVFQFAISAFLIAATIIIQKQLYFIQNKKLGYDREHVLVLPMNARILSNISVIKKELKTNPSVLSVTSTYSTPVKIAGGYSIRTETMPENEQIAVAGNPIDEDYIQTVGLQLISGNDLSEQDMRDVSWDNVDDRKYHFILNEKAAEQLGWTPESAIGQKMFMGSRYGTVKGVVKDFHFESMHVAIKPLVLFSEIRGRNLLLKINGVNLIETISALESKWKSLVPYAPFEYHFLDDDYNELYKSELNLGTIMNLFATIAIVLACIGLFGLSSYTVKQRVKEIGIRKVLGASTVNIVALLSGNFIRLVLIAILLSSPLAYFLMRNWLQDFAYRIDIEWWVFALVGLLAIAIALLTTSLQSIKAAVMNPVESLKSE